jgi:two-component system phosphate regulon sensor histidine kinase PhoR
MARHIEHAATEKKTTSLRALLKAVAIVSTPSLIVLSIFTMLDIINISHFLLGYGMILMALSLVLRTFLANINGLIAYVEQLAQDVKPDAPDLSLLSNIGQLSEALSRLQTTWERKRQQMEHIITEREILLDTLPDILIMINDERVILRTNRAARSIFGQNLAHKKLKDIIPSDGLLSAVSSVISDLRGREIEFHLDHGESRDFRAIIERFPVPTGGGISTIITLNDVTELKRAEQMRADFVANASHEIRTPLASILGFIETLQGPAKDDPGAREQFLSIMAEQAQRMSRLVGDLLSLSKIEMNAHSQPLGRVNLAEVLKKECAQFDWAARQKHMAIHLNVPDVLPEVRGEEGELTQVIHNLIGNAVKYGSPETDIFVTARVTSQLPNDSHMRHLDRAVYVSVRDHGEGIPKEHIPRLTERFYRVDTARTRKVGGTGLGLAIVKHILNRHRGALSIESVVGEGSTFTVYLPINQDLEKLD